MYTTRRTVLSYLAALGPAVSLPSGCLLRGGNISDAAGARPMAQCAELYVAQEETIGILAPRRNR